MAKPNDQQIGSSAIVDMEVIDDHSDYEVDFNAAPAAPAAAKHETNPAGSMDEFKGKMAQNVGAYVWKEGSEKAKKAFSVYANIDFLRPYFDVEPREVRSRLMYSLIPKLSPMGAPHVAVPDELYGPTMLVFTLIALLLFQMKSSGHSVQEGTLMGTAFAVSFGYWIGVSCLICVLSYVCNTRIKMLQILHMLGYALFGHCLVLFVSTVWHGSSHLSFYLMWAVVGGVSAFKMVSILLPRTPGRSQRLIICGTVAALHLLFLLYLHFAFHEIVEELSAAVQLPAQPALQPLPDKPIPEKKDVDNMVKILAQNGPEPARPDLTVPAANQPLIKPASNLAVQPQPAMVNSQLAAAHPQPATNTEVKHGVMREEEPNLPLQLHPGRDTNNAPQMMAMPRHPQDSKQPMPREQAGGGMEAPQLIDAIKLPPAPTDNKQHNIPLSNQVIPGRPDLAPEPRQLGPEPAENPLPGQNPAPVESPLQPLAPTALSPLESWLKHRDEPEFGSNPLPARLPSDGHMVVDQIAADRAVGRLPVPDERVQLMRQEVMNPGETHNVLVINSELEEPEEDDGGDDEDDVEGEVDEDDDDDEEEEERSQGAGNWEEEEEPEEVFPLSSLYHHGNEEGVRDEDIPDVEKRNAPMEVDYQGYVDGEGVLHG